MSLGEPLEIMNKVVEIFEKLQVKYFVGGSLASSLHGIPRATQNVDLVADLNINQVKSFVKVVEKEFYVSEEMIIDAIKRHSSFNIIHLEGMFKVDIFILKDDPYSQEELMRREKVQITEKGQILYVASAEDVIIEKLKWYELGGRISDRQWNDLLGVLQVQGNKLDKNYLQKIANKLGLMDLLKKAFEDAML